MSSQKHTTSVEDKSTFFRLAMVGTAIGLLISVFV